MKTIFTFFAIAIFWNIVFLTICRAQFYGHDSLDINNIGARINVLGDNFDDLATNMSAFDAPINTNMHTIYASALWIGGFENGNLKIAAMTYRQNGVDFFPGPLDTLTDSVYSNTEMTSWDQIWKVKRSEINDFLTNGTISTSMTNWPGNGNSNAHEAKRMAPFIDVAGDGIYDPKKGDYPDIKGDEMLWWVMNDNGGPHGEAQSQALGVEVQCEAYAFKSVNTAINNTIFLDYKIINRSPMDIENVFVGLWTDFDIGYAFDDYIGSAPKLNAYFGYNGKPTDAVYGSNPPVESVVFLKDSISRFLYYNNSASPVNGNPNAVDYYNYMRGLWKNGACMKYGSKDGVSGTQCTDFMFDGAPSDTLSGWTEHNVGNTPGDVRGLGSIGPMTIKAGQTYDLPVAYVFSRQTGNANGYGNIATNYDSTVQYWKQIRAFYNSNFTTAGINNQIPSSISMKIYPDPASERIFIQCPNQNLQKIVIIDMIGRTVYTNSSFNSNMTQIIDVSAFSNGMYTVLADGKSGNFSQKFLIAR